MFDPDTSGFFSTRTRVRGRGTFGPIPKTMATKRLVLWFRNDLRCRDNPALFNACQHAKGMGVVAVATLCPEQWSRHDESTARVEFWLANLRALDTELAKLNIPLRVICAGTFDKVPDQLLALANELNCDGLFLNREYCLNEVVRDRQVVDSFHDAGIKVYGFHGDVVLPLSLIHI